MSGMSRILPRMIMPTARAAKPKTKPRETRMTIPAFANAASAKRPGAE